MFVGVCLTTVGLAWADAGAMPEGSAAYLVSDAVLRERENGRSWMDAARRDFAERRFGVFIHWGLYAMYGQGEWYLERGKLDEKIYSQAMGGFYPSKFDAKEWVRVVKGAGAKYITITSRHHDGFSLWPTKVDDGYNVGNTPFKRDILGELAEACRESGIQLNLYYSLMDWHRKDYPTGREKNARSTIVGRKEDYASYKRFMMGQLTELLDAYHPGCIWFDGEWDHDPKDVNSVGLDVPCLDWEFDSLYDLIHSRHALVANNNHKVPRDKEDISLFERDLPGENETGFSPGQAVVDDRPLEQCDVIQTGIWGFVVGDGKNFRSPQEVCAMICRAAAKGSNLLMNIGPQADGRLPDRAVAVMAEVGKWMSANGDAIYGTRGAGLVKNADGTEIAKTKKGDKVLTIILRDGRFPTVLK